jgi:large subunit ribosomal protein L9
MAAFFVNVSVLMANQQVLLVKPVKGLGHEGEAVKVKAGYARNFLFPQKMAVPVNQGTKRQLEVLAKRREERLTKETAAAKELAERMAAMVLTVMVKVGEDGRPHGTVTNMEIQKSLKALEIEVDRHQIKTGEAIKTLGEHIVTVKLHSEITAELKLNVVSDAPEKSVEKTDKKEGKRAPRQDAVVEAPVKKAKKNVKSAE